MQLDFENSDTHISFWICKKYVKNLLEFFFAIIYGSTVYLNIILEIIGLVSALPEIILTSCDRIIVVECRRAPSNQDLLRMQIKATGSLTVIILLSIFFFKSILSHNALKVSTYFFMSYYWLNTVVGFFHCVHHMVYT